MKKELKIVFCLSLVLILSFSFISAFSFSDFWETITGQAVENTGTWTECLSNVEGANCNEVCNNKGKTFSNTCTTSRGYENWGLEAWLSGQNCQGDGAGQQRKEDFSLDSSIRWKCCCEGISECTPNCAGKECGDDGCVGSCGICGTGYECNSHGQCVEQIQSLGICSGVAIPCFKLKDIISCENQQGCSWGSITANAIAPENPLPSSCSGVAKDCKDFSEETFCENQQGCSWKENCVPNCVNKECGGDGCGGSCGTCDEGYECVKGICVEKITPIRGNKKDISKYFNDQVFLISDKNWKDVLQLVPLTTWTQQQGDDSECQRGYGTADSVCVYPTLIFHEEENNNLYIDMDDYYSWQKGSNIITIGLTFLNGGSWSYKKSISKKFNLQPGELITFYYNITTADSVVEKIEITHLPDFLEFVEPVNGIINNINSNFPDWHTFEFILKVKNDTHVEIHKSFDADSIIYFMQQDNTEKVKIVGETPQELDNLLIAEPELGAGINQNQVQRIKPEDYLNYWVSYEDVVYVEDNYELGLMASTYASLINAPLIIQGTELDVPEVFAGRNIICVGSVSPSGATCNEQDNLEQLQKKYVDETNTDKIILVNPNDLNIKVEELFQPEKSANPVYEIYSKISLASPILASAKHEIIISTTATDYEKISDFVKEKVNDLIPKIINNKNGLQRNNYASPTKRIYRKNLSTGKESAIYLVNDYAQRMILSDGKILFKDGSFYVYDIKSQNLQKVRLNVGSIYSDDFSQDKIFYEVSGSNPIQECNLFLYDTLTSEQLFIKSYPNQCQSKITIDGENLAWVANAEKGVCIHNETISCSGASDCSKFCSNDGSSCEIITDCNVGNWCWSDICKMDDEVYVKEGAKTEQKIFTSEYIKIIKISKDNMIFIDSGKGNEKLLLYNISSGQTEIIKDEDLFLAYSDIDGNNVIWVESFYEMGRWINKLYLYNIKTKQKVFISDIWGEYPPQISNGKILWLISNGICENTGLSCLENLDCGSFCTISGKSCGMGDENSWNSCSSEESCVYEQCASTKAYIYDIDSSQTTSIDIPFGAQNILIKDDEIFYTNEEKYDFYLSGFLTIFGAPNAIPLREEMSAIGNCYDNYRSLDHTGYGDIYLEDRYSDMSVGRVQGITISDVSSYLGRDLFYDKTVRTKNIQFMASSFDYMLKNANSWTQIFNNVGYNAHCSIQPTPYISGKDLICDIDNSLETWPNLWKSKDMISYMDHGSPNWAGIDSNEIPYLENSIVYSDACLTCSTYNSHSFCNNVLRKGGLGYLGAVSTGWAGNKIYKNTMNGIYKDKLTLGESFTKAYVYDPYEYMTTLLGDPTLDINPDYNLDEGLP